MEADDRISQLPDDILIHILSFIPTLDSVASCMLSTRWKHLWKHVPILTFDDRKTKSHNVRFANFVNNVLNSHVPKVLEKLSLTCFDNHASRDVGNWVSDSIMRNIQSLDLHIHSTQDIRLPSNLFTCKTLEALVLKSRYHNISVNFPTTVCLPNLKTMKLGRLKYQDNQRDGLGKLISSCSSLESLVVEDRGIGNHYVGFLTISSSTLRDMEFRLSAPQCIIGCNPEIFCPALRRLNLNIDSYYYDGKIFRVPSNVFTWNTLEQLVLNSLFLSCAVKSICLPNLTFLALHFVEFQDDEILSRLISSCTSLRSLAVQKFTNGEMNISSCTLKVAEINLLGYSKLGHKLVMSTPALKSLELRSVGYVDYHIQELASLEQADVSIRFDRFISSESDYCCTALTNAYQALRHVKSLKVCQGCSNVDVSGYVLPMFNRLTELDITINSMLGYSLCQKLITNSTKLENLVIVLSLKAFGIPYWKNLTSVPACLLSSLRSVSIRHFRGHEDDLTMMIYILGNAKILEKMEVSFSRHCSEAKKWELCTKILNVPRGSEKCEVVIK